MSASPGSRPIVEVSPDCIRANRRVGSIEVAGSAVKDCQRVRFSPSVAITTSATSPFTTYPGSKTTAPIDDPSASFSSVSPSGSSADSSAHSASVVPSSGVGTKALPSSSSATAASASSPPAPPDSSGTTRAATPTCSHSSFHSDSS